MDELKPWIDKADVVVVGPGMGQERETVDASIEIVRYLKAKNKPSVIDADALKSVAGMELFPNAVITPHAGEFKIYSGVQPDSNMRKRIEQVKECSLKCNCVVLLKGYVDIIAEKEEFKLNKTGNPGMAVGGTGDTLTGIIASFMAQKLSPFTSAYLGAFVNGLAGSIAYEKLGAHLVATDIIENIPKVINEPLEVFKKKVYKRILDT